MTQQTERERLAGLLEREASSYTSVGNQAQWADELRKAAALLRGDEPAKPDRYMEVWKEAYAAYTSQSLTKDGPDRAAAAVLRKHFEVPREVVEAAKRWRVSVSVHSDVGIMRDFILKGDQ